MIQQATLSEQLAELFEVRKEVFVQEQGVPEYLEYDEFEETSQHYGYWQAGTAVACARWRIVNGNAKIERCAVRKPYRKKNIGAELVHYMINEIPANYVVYLHAQTSALGFYSRLGFEAVGCEFEEAGIAHFKMVLACR